jgi:hypothetical protein
VRGMKEEGGRIDRFMYGQSTTDPIRQCHYS